MLREKLNFQLSIHFHDASAPFLKTRQVSIVLRNDIAEKRRFFIGYGPHVLGCRLLKEINLCQAFFTLYKILDVEIGHHAEQHQRDKGNSRNEKKLRKDREIV